MRLKGKDKGARGLGGVKEVKKTTRGGSISEATTPGRKKIRRGEKNLCFVLRFKKMNP